jgi:prophage maintenance system killer protein
VRYVLPSELLDYNRRLTGDFGIGDEGHGFDWARLTDAIQRPQESVDDPPYDLYPSIHEKAAALLDSLITKPPFEEMNDATALLGVYLFYRENGYAVDVPDDQLLAYVKDRHLPAGNASLAVFLGKHTRAEESDSTDVNVSER